MLLLHGLEQRRLGTRARAIDLVGHQQLTENRSRDEPEAALAARAFFQHFAAKDVRGHQIRGELDTPGIQAKHDAHGFDQLGLGKAGHADQHPVTA